MEWWLPLFSQHPVPGIWPSELRQWKEQRVPPSVLPPPFRATYLHIHDVLPVAVSDLGLSLAEAAWLCRIMLPHGILALDKWACMCLYIQVNENDSLKWLTFIFEKTKLAWWSSWVCQDNTFQVFPQAIQPTLWEMPICQRGGRMPALSMPLPEAAPQVSSVGTSPVRDTHKEPPETAPHTSE